MSRGPGDVYKRQVKKQIIKNQVDTKKEDVIEVVSVKNNEGA